MTAQGLLQVALYTAVLIAAAWPLGRFMTAIYEGRRTWFTPIFGGLERAIYRVAGVDERSESDWRRYAVAVLVFNVIGFAVVYFLQRLQGVLPLNPQGFAAVSPDDSVSPVPVAPAVPTTVIVRVSTSAPAPTCSVSPTEMPVTLATLRLVSPAAATALSVVARPWVPTAVTERTSPSTNAGCPTT